MPRPSPQFLIAAAASILAMSAFALSVPMAGGNAHGARGLLPAEASFGPPALPTLFPR